MIAIVDTGGANIASVQYALSRLGIEGTFTKDPHQITRASHVVFPGVGAAKDSMDRLKAEGLVSVLQELTVPTLGICLGMQLLFEASSEGPTECLGILPGTVQKLDTSPGLTIPHMGWNRLARTATQSPLLEGIPEGQHFYFVHSYCAPMGTFVTGTTEHGQVVPAMVSKNNFHGVQFHPERSGVCGAQILKNFLKL